MTTSAMVRKFAEVVVCATLLISGANALLRELPRVEARPPAGQSAPPGRWHLGWPAIDLLKSELLRVEAQLPEGALVAVEAPQLDPSELFFFSMWCSYYLPRHSVLRRSVVRARHRSESGDFLLRWPAGPETGDLVYRGEVLSVGWLHLGPEAAPRATR